MTRFLLPELDDSWQAQPLGKLATIRYGSALVAASRADDGLIPVYGSGGKVGVHNEPLHNKKSIIVGRKGSVGSVFLTEGPFWCIDTAYYLDDLSDSLNLDYLAAYLQSLDLSRLAISVAVPGLNRQELAAIPIPLPTLPEQQRIVDVLQQAGAVAKAKQSICELLDRLVRTAYWEFFGAWYTTDGLLEPVRISEYVTDSQYGVSEAMEETGSHAVLRMNSITTSGWLDLSNLKYANLSQKDIESTALQDGDLLFNRTNSKELVGKCAIWRPNGSAFSFASYLLRLRLKNGIVPEYLWATLNSAYGKYRLLNSAKQAVNMANVSPADLGRITVPLPPLPLQEKFAKLVKHIECLRAQIVNKLDSFAELQSNINQLALLGELTGQWRDNHAVEIAKAAKARDSLLRERDAAFVSTSSKISIHFNEYAPCEQSTGFSRPRQQAPIGGLPSFQHKVWNTMCFEWRGAVLADSPTVFEDFCSSPQTAWRLPAGVKGL